MRTSVIVYIFWATFLIISGIYVTHKINDKTDPNSLNSRFENLRNVIDGNP